MRHQSQTSMRQQAMTVQNQSTGALAKAEKPQDANTMIAGESGGGTVWQQL